MREVLGAVMEWVPAWEADPENEYRGAKAIVNVGAIEGGFGWRVSRTPHRTDLFLDVRVPPTKPMAVARRQVLDMVRGLRERFPDYGIEGEVYVTAPGAEIAEDHPLVAALDESHAEVFGMRPGRDVTRWFSDASVLSRYGIATVNYGTSTGLLDTIKGADLGQEGGRLILDFNYAYNPSCAYNPRWDCPLAPPENVLLVEIRAGEQRYPDAEG